MITPEGDAEGEKMMIEVKVNMTTDDDGTGNARALRRTIVAALLGCVVTPVTAAPRLAVAAAATPRRRA